jgi:hypothetical protein
MMLSTMLHSQGIGATIEEDAILYIKATVVSFCLSVCGDKQGRAGAGQGGQGRHSPTGPAGGP